MVSSKKQKSDGVAKADDRNTRSSGSKTKKKTKPNKAESKGIVKKEAEVYEISESSSSGEARRDEPKESNGVVVEDAKMIRFPMNRIRRIMRSDNSAPQIMQDAVFLVNKATELFIEKFSEEAYGSSVKDKKKFIHYKHLSSVASNEERYEFLADCVPEKLKAEVALEEWERVMADELFIEKFSEEAYGSSVKDKKKFIHYKHLSSVASNEERYEFLADCVPEKLKAEVALEEWERVMADVV